jgi:hypothetical protein
MWGENCMHVHSFMDNNVKMKALSVQKLSLETQMFYVRHKH